VTGINWVALIVLILLLRAGHGDGFHGGPLAPADRTSTRCTSGAWAARASAR
jgi:hypothetical protein